MKIEENFKDTDCYKITCVSLKPDSCRIIKGPEEERRLAEALLDDYHISRYEKMIQLIVREMIEENYQKEFFRIFSLEHLQEEFQKGRKKVAYSYLRKVDGQVRSVTTVVYPRKQGEHGEVEEFIMYVFIEE